MGRKEAPARSDFHWFTPITTRWSDNDVYGHVNNVIYYSYFDSVANRYLIEEGGLDIQRGETIGLVVNSGCDYFQPVAYPEMLEGALRVNRLGSSSVEYGIGIFRASAHSEGDSVTDSGSACACGSFTHVFVDRATSRPVPIPQAMRAALERIAAGA